jgi:thioredoxin-like negative regulator of GroEL
MSRAEHLVEVNEGDFEKEVMESGIPVLVDFFTPPCAPCKALVPVLERAARKYPNIKVVKVNAWNNQSLCARWKIVGVPALLLFKSGQNILRIDGFDDSTERRIEDGLNGILES